MTALAVQAAALACVLGGYTIACRPLAAAPLWTLPPLPVFEYMGAVEGWSPVAALTATPVHDDAGILDGDGHLPMTTGEYLTLQADVHEQTVEALDSIEATMSAGLADLEAFALQWLGADLDAEHALMSIAAHAADVPALSRMAESDVDTAEWVAGVLS